MDIDYIYDSEANFTRYNVKGLFNVEDVSTTIAEAMRQVDLDRPYLDLWDMRGLELTDNTSSLVWTMAETTRQRASTQTRPKGKTALVADAAHLFGLGRMYEQMLSDNVHWEHQVFSDVDHAMVWLFGC